MPAVKRATSEEVQRLVRAAAERTDAKRRTWPFTLTMSLSSSVLFWAPLMPGHEQILGAATAWDGLVIWALFVASMLAALWAHRRQGSSGRVYLVAETVEAVVLYGTPLWMQGASGLTWSIMWFIQGSNAMFAALVKPWFAVRWGALMFGANLLLAMFCLATARSETAALSAVSGLVSWFACAAVGRWLLGDFEAEAERDRLNRELLALRREREQREQRELASALDGIVGKELTCLAAKLAADPALAVEAAQARAISHALGVDAAATEPVAKTTREAIIALARSIDEKCRPLCEGLRYEQLFTGDGEATLDSACSVAILRVAQELVRNAVTHGRPRKVEVELANSPAALRLSVRDDGSGFPAETLTSAAGGLRNLKHRLEELGGTLELVAATRRTELLATIPKR